MSHADTTLPDGRPIRIESCYRPANNGVILLYSGPLVVEVGDEQMTVEGDLELRLHPRSKLQARIADPFRDLHFLMLSSQDPVVSLPSDTSLSAPKGSGLPERTGTESSSDHPISINHIVAGELSSATRFRFHISGAFRGSFPWVECADGSKQERLTVSLGEWDVVIADVNGSTDEQNFTFVVEARPRRTMTAADVERLRWTLFLGLSFTASREVGVDPVCGLDADGRIAWVEVGPPRVRLGQPGVRWCPRLRVADALPVVLSGIDSLGSDGTMHQIVKRAIGFLHGADGSEVLDVRVPMACAGLELLSWAVLQREGWVNAETLDKLSAGASVRLLMQWAGVPTALPESLSALADRIRRLGRKDWSGPEVAFDLRNRFVHPPRRIGDPSWPSPSELLEAWQLATWYLELTILRLIDYRGPYASRLVLGKWENETEPVPWTSAGGNGEAH